MTKDSLKVQGAKLLIILERFQVKKKKRKDAMFLKTSVNNEQEIFFPALSQWSSMNNSHLLQGKKRREMLSCLLPRPLCPHHTTLQD